MWTTLQKNISTLMLDDPAEYCNHGLIDGMGKVENGLYVYEVIDQAGVEIRKGASFKGGPNRSGSVPKSLHHQCFDIPD